MGAKTYWGVTPEPQHRFFLCPASDKVVACFLLEPHPHYPESFKDGLTRLGGVWSWDYESIESACVQTLGSYQGHLEIGPEQYLTLNRQKSCWIWMLDDIIDGLVPIMRSQWVANREIPDHVNKFYSTLGFNEFHASQHSYLKEHGHMPPMIEGLSLV